MQEDPNACPKCGGELDRVSVDIGVGIQHGPWGCLDCGWSSDSDFDCTDAWSAWEPKSEGGGSVDPFGGWSRDPLVHDAVRDHVSPEKRLGFLSARLSTDDAARIFALDRAAEDKDATAHQRCAPSGTWA